MQDVTCVACGTTFQAGSPRARYCSAKCRKRGSRAGAGSIAKLDPVEPCDQGLVDVTRRELERAGAVDSVLGQQALELARRITSPMSTAGSVATLSRELRAVMIEAARVAPVASGLDELRSRRDRKRHAG